MLQIFSIDAGNRTRKVVLAHCAVAHTDHDGLGKHLGILFEDDLDILACLHLFGEIAHIGNLKL